MNGKRREYLNNKFSRNERLNESKLIQELFLSGRSFFKYPFKVTYKKSSKAGEYPARFAISVAKKRIKHAIDRNYIKRITREAYRKNKNTLYQGLEDMHIDIMLVFIGNVDAKYELVHRAIIAINKRIISDFEKSYCDEN